MCSCDADNVFLFQNVTSNFPLKKDKKESYVLLYNLITISIQNMN